MLLDDDGGFFVDQLFSSVGVSCDFARFLISLESWDILGVGYDELVIAQLRGNDGKEDHVITIARRMVFDSNMVHALPLTRETLDICCRSDENETDIFEKVVHARKFFRYKPPCKKISGKKAKKRRNKSPNVC